MACRNTLFTIGTGIEMKNSRTKSKENEIRYILSPHLTNFPSKAINFAHVASNKDVSAIAKNLKQQFFLDVRWCLKTAHSLCTYITDLPIFGRGKTTFYTDCFYRNDWCYELYLSLFLFCCSPKRSVLSISGKNIQLLGCFYVMIFAERKLFQWQYTFFTI